MDHECSIIKLHFAAGTNQLNIKQGLLTSFLQKTIHHSKNILTIRDRSDYRFLQYQNGDIDHTANVTDVTVANTFYRLSYLHSFIIDSGHYLCSLIEKNISCIRSMSISTLWAIPKKP